MQRQSLALVLVATLLLTTATTPVIAAETEDSGLVDDLTDDDASWYATIDDYLLGWANRLKNGAVSVLSDSTTTGVHDCQQAQEYFNEHSTAFQEWVNTRAEPSSDWDVTAITCERNGESATVYVTADVVNGSYTNLTADDTTDRTVDHELTVSDSASQALEAELERFHDTFVEPNESVSREYLARLAGEYSDDVQAAFLTNES